MERGVPQKDPFGTPQPPVRGRPTALVLTGPQVAGSAVRERTSRSLPLTGDEMNEQQGTWPARGSCDVLAERSLRRPRRFAQAHVDADDAPLSVAAQDERDP